MSSSKFTMADRLKGTDKNVWCVSNVSVENAGLYNTRGALFGLFGSGSS